MPWVQAVQPLSQAGSLEGRPQPTALCGSVLPALPSTPGSHLLLGPRRPGCLHVWCWLAVSPGAHPSR